MLAPVRWVVQGVAVVPEAVAPGVLLSLVILLVWFLFVQRGGRHLWDACCRGAARAFDLVVGLALAPEYALTTARRQRGGAPSRRALALGDVADTLLDGTASFYEKHRREPMRWRTPPWAPCLVVLLLCAGAWALSNHLSDTSIVRYRLAQAYDRWRDVEAWAGADPATDAAPQIVRARRHRRTLGVRLRCRTSAGCSGWIVVERRSGAPAYARHVAMDRGTVLIHVRLTHEQLRAARGGRLIVEPS